MSEPKFVIPSGVQLLGVDGSETARLEVFDEARVAADPSIVLLTEDAVEAISGVEGAVTDLEIAPAPLVEEFLGADGAATVGEAKYGWTETVASGGVVDQDGTTRAALTPGAQTTGSAALEAANYRFLGFPVFTMVFSYFQATGNETADRFVAKFGLLSMAGVTAHDVAWFEVDRDSDEVNNFVCKTNDNSTTESTDSGVAAVPNSTKQMKITSDGSAIRFYIDDVLEATHTTNLPTAFSTYGPKFEITKTAGTGPREHHIDYVGVRIEGR